MLELLARRWDVAMLVAAVLFAIFWRFDPSTALKEQLTGPPDDLRCAVEPHERDCFVRIPGATFLMGAQSTDPSAPGYDPDALPNEGPPHEVTVSDFWIGRTEASAEGYWHCVQAGGCSEDEIATGGLSSWDDVTSRAHPINNISWKGAVDLCTWMGGRLPTEAEWELAARGTDGRIFPWGDEPRCGVEGFAACTRDGPHDATRSDVGAHDLLGMAGNVWEWTADGYTDDYTGHGGVDPRGPAEEDRKVQRGGGWNAESPADLRSTGRAGVSSSVRLNDVGFRCAWGGAW